MACSAEKFASHTDQPDSKPYPFFTESAHIQAHSPSHHPTLVATMNLSDPDEFDVDGRAINAIFDASNLEYRAIAIRYEELAKVFGHCVNPYILECVVRKDVAF